MKHKVGDKVRIKSTEWYNKNKNINEIVDFGSVDFVMGMSVYCGKMATIINIETNPSHYDIDIDNDDYAWTDEMFEDDEEYTYLDIDLPEWWDGRPIYGEAWDNNNNNKKNGYCIGIDHRLGHSLRYLISNHADNLIWHEYFKPLPKQQTSAKVVITKDGKAREVELTDEQINKLGI